MISKVKHFPVGIIGGGPVGLFLSCLLSKYNVNHCLIEKRVDATKHPQAHFMTARSMEVIRSHFPNVYNEIISKMSDSLYWRDFVFCHSILGNQIGRVDNFAPFATNPSFWQETSANVAHFPQYEFENILRKQVNNLNKDNLFFGSEINDIKYKENKYTLTCSNNIKISCDYLIGADGSNSLVRKYANIKMKGNNSLQTLINVHFTCKGLKYYINNNSGHSNRPAMLYFVFNEEAVAVYVAHDINKDEWVCQIPIFPPYQTLKDDFNENKIKLIISKTIGITKESKLSIDIHNVNTWTMHAEVAEKFSENKIFLIGDAAHRFPPAGGFGMNTGLHDAHNIAWKLAKVVNNNASEKILTSYDVERKQIATETTALSLKNYEKTINTAATLGVDPMLAQSVVKGVTLAPLIPFAIKKKIIQNALQTGLLSLKIFSSSAFSFLSKEKINQLNNLIQNKEVLPLIFPKADIHYNYSNGLFNYKNTSSSNSNLVLRIGSRIPHVWLNLDHTNYIISAIDINSYVHQLPTICIITTNENLFSLLQSVLNSDKKKSELFKIVYIHSIESNVPHEYIQQKLQYPCYIHNSENLKDIGYTYFDISLRKDNYNKNGIILTDVTGEWNRVQESNTLVVIRPDDFVYDISDPSSVTSYDDLNNYLDNIVKKIFINC